MSRVRLGWVLGLLFGALGCRHPPAGSGPAPSSSAPARVRCPTDPTEQSLERLLSPAVSAGRVSAAQRLALGALYRRRGCLAELKATLASLEGELSTLEPETWSRWAELMAATESEMALRSLARRAAEAPYPTQTALAFRRAAGYVDCAKPASVKLVEATSRALLARDPTLGALFPADGPARLPSSAEVAQLADNAEPLALLGSVAIVSASCSETALMARAAAAVLGRVHPRLLPKLPLFGLRDSATLIAIVLLPDREKVATDLALTEYLLDPGACVKQLPSWQRRGFSPVGFAGYLGSLPKDDHQLGSCLTASAVSVPSDSPGLQRLMANLPPVVRVAPALARDLADRAWAALGRTRTDRITVDLALADLMATELALVDWRIPRPKLCELLTTELRAPEDTLRQWRRLAAAEAIRACPVQAEAILGQSGDDSRTDAAEMVRRLARRDRARATRLIDETLARTRPEERVELAAELLYALEAGG